MLVVLLAILLLTLETVAAGLLDKTDGLLLLNKPLAACGFPLERTPLALDPVPGNLANGLVPELPGGTNRDVVLEDDGLVVVADTTEGLIETTTFFVRFNLGLTRFLNNCFRRLVNFFTSIFLSFSDLFTFPERKNVTWCNDPH